MLDILTDSNPSSQSIKSTSDLKELCISVHGPVSGPLHFQVFRCSSLTPFLWVLEKIEFECQSWLWAPHFRVDNRKLGTVSSLCNSQTAKHNYKQSIPYTTFCAFGDMFATLCHFTSRLPFQRHQWHEQTRDSWLKIATWNVNSFRQKINSQSVCSNLFQLYSNHSNLVRFHGQFMVISQPEMCTLFQLLRQIPLKSKKRGTSFGDSQQEWNRWHESIL